MGSYSRLAGGVFTDIVIISHSNVLGGSPKEQTSPCHLASGFHFSNAVADNFIIENLDSQMVVHECWTPRLAFGNAKELCLLIITTQRQKRQTTACTRLLGIRLVKMGYRHIPDLDKDAGNQRKIEFTKS